MTSHLNRRQVLLFLFAVVLPCSVLVALSLRMMSQQRELAEKRLSEEQRRVLNEISRELLARLEKVKLQQVTALAMQGNGTLPSKPADPAIVLVGWVEENRLLLPWDTNPVAQRSRTLLRESRFARFINQGEHEEFVANEFVKAAASYRTAMNEARHPIQAANAKLMLSRALARSGQQREALVMLRGVLSLPSDFTDEQGIALCLYAAERLLHASASREAVLERIRSEVGTLEGRAPAEVYILRDLVSAIAGSVSGPTERAATADLQRAMSGHIRHLEQALAFQRDFPALGLAQAAAGSLGNSEQLWVPYGVETWLVSVAPASETAPAVVIGVRAEDVFAWLREAGSLSYASTGQAHILSDPSAKGEALGANFPGLKISFPQQDVTALAKQWNPQRTFYVVTLLLVLSITLFAAYLLWRDVRREVRLAAMRSQFVSSVSHELKTPLTAIRIFAETLGMGRAADPHMQSEYLETIVNETQRLTRLLNNVLDFSKIEKGKRIYRLEPTCLAEVVQAAARTLQYPLAQQGFKLQVEIENGLPAVRVDADAIEQAILNLLTNAMKYSGESREIDLQLHLQGGRAVIEVRDKGVGIQREEQPRIFEKFYRAPTPENLRVPGTGLGLALVEHIAKAHGGHVEVQSEPGKGSTFFIYLPLEGAV